MAIFETMNTVELQDTQGGAFDPISFAIGIAINGLIEAATGKSGVGWAAEGFKAVFQAVEATPATYPSGAKPGIYIQY